MSNPTAPPSYGEAMDDKSYNAEGAYPAGQPYATQYGAAPTGVWGPPLAPATGYAQPVAQPYVYTPQPGAGDNVPFVTGAGFPASADHPVDISGIESGFSTRASFNDKNIRRNFIRRVFIILGLQLLVTFGIVCVFSLVDSVGVWVRHHSALYWVSYGVFLVLYFVLICIESARRRHPHNLIMLTLFTLSLSYMTGTIAAYYSTQSVMIALGVTVVVCVAVILFSMQTKFDFTKCSGVLFVLCMVLFLFGIITIFTWHRNWYLQVVYGCLGALVFTLFLAFDTQLVMGGKKHQLDPEEYVYGALTLYIDVVYIFLFILSIFGGSNN